VVLLKTFDDLNKVVEAFSNNKLNFVIIHSRGGLAKSWIARHAITEGCFFQGHATPLAIYLQACKNPNSLLVFDDVDMLLKSRTNVALLKQLCNNDSEKVVTYTTTAKVNDKDVPESFCSCNKVLILANEISRIGRNMGALLSRAHVFEFDPTIGEVFGYIRSFAEDSEVVEFLMSHRKVLSDFSVRTYAKAKELKGSGLDWKHLMLSDPPKDAELELARELRGMRVDDRNAAWVRQTGKSVRSLQRILRRIEK